MINWVVYMHKQMNSYLYHTISNKTLFCVTNLDKSTKKKEHLTSNLLMTEKEACLPMQVVLGVGTTSKSEEIS